jgi:hypothetical protein
VGSDDRSHAVDAAVEAVEAVRLHTTVDGVGADPCGEELPAGDDAVLPRGERGDGFLERSALSAPDAHRRKLSTNHMIFSFLLDRPRIAR